MQLCRDVIEIVALFVLAILVVGVVVTTHLSLVAFV